MSRKMIHLLGNFAHNILLQLADGLTEGTTKVINHEMLVFSQLTPNG